jgi:hypothetical protein
LEGGHAEDIRSGEFEEGRRGSGTLGGKFNRKQTGKSDWDETKALTATREAADAWDRLPTP